MVDFGYRLMPGDKGAEEDEYIKQHQKYIEFNKAAAIFWQQRSKSHWLKEGDASTRFFFNSVKARTHHNAIVGIKNNSGDWVFEEDDLRNSFQNFFQDLYGADLDNSSSTSFSSSYGHLFHDLHYKLTADQQDSLNKPFSKTDVRTAVFQLGPLKSPGPDGIPALFYQKYWFYIKDDVTAAVLEMLNSGNIYAHFNRTNIALIPKVTAPELVEQFRPISLCNVIIKIVTKCIANRLRKFMASLVGEFQNGFIPGRSISDNILISHELFHHISRKTKGKQGLLAFKVDMSKAYDRLSWNFLLQTMSVMNFPPKLINLIMNCVSSVSYHIIINGNAGRGFKPTSGVRQGDPLSPYLFALCTEILSHLILQAERSKKLKGIQICRSSDSISHLLFADDSIFFLHADPRYCSALMKVLQSYCEASGQKINTEKSAVIFSPNCNLRNTQKCLQILKVPGKKEMGKYLGLPTEFGASKKQIFAFLIDKVRKRIMSWNNSYLTPAGRLTLINSVLSSLSIFSLSAFRMPVSVNSKLDALFSQFWWRGSINGRGFHWCSKLFLSSPKSSGGLGIRNMGCLNQGLLAKIGWRILQNSQILIGRTLGKKYGLNPETISSIISCSNTSISWGHRGVLWGVDLLRPHLAWQVGFPSMLNFWKDKWIHGKSLAEILTLSEMEVNTKPEIQVSQLQTIDGRWDYNQIRHLCGEAAVSQFRTILIPPLETEDTFYWTISKTGCYSVKSGYGSAFSSLWHAKATSSDLSRIDNRSSLFCKKKLWSLPIPGKWRLFLWKLLTNTLPVGSEFVKRRLDWNPNCSFCINHDHLETLEHLFRDCPFASHVWAASPLGLRCHMSSSIGIQSWILNWFSLFLKEKDPSTSISYFMSGLWRLWCGRNNLKFNSQGMDIRSTMQLLNDDALMNIQVQAQKHKIIPMDPTSFTNLEMIRHYYPYLLIGNERCPSSIRVKCDASWKVSFHASAGWVFLSSVVEISRTGQATFWASSALQAEAIALYLTLADAAEAGFMHVDINTDCLCLIYQVAELQELYQEVKPIIQHIRHLLPSFHCVSISFCPRILNKTAHNIAQSAM